MPKFPNSITLEGKKVDVLLLMNSIDEYAIAEIEVFGGSVQFP